MWSPQMFLPLDMPIRTDICGSIPNDLRVVTSCDPQEPSGMEKTRTPVRIVVTADGGRSSLAASNGPGHLGNALPPNTQFIAVAAVPDGEPASDDGVHPTTAFVQYVESTGDGIYATANGQIAYPVYTVADGTVFTSNGGAYYTTSGGNSTSSAVTFAPVSGQTLTTAVVGNATYLLPHIDSSATEAGQPTTAAVTTNALPHVAVTSAAAVAVMSPSRTSPQTDSTVTFIMTTATNSAGQASDSDASQQSLAHANRVSPVTVQWLMENYETAEGVSLPRSTLYKHYIRHCSENNLDPVNPASFGKLIRSVFIGLRTRRLGTRGNSKYHYYGIRVKPTSPLNELTTMDDEDEDECASPTGAELKSDMKQYHAASSDNVGGNGAGCSKIGRTDHQVCAADMAQSSDVTNKGSCHGHQHPHSHLGEPATPFPAFPAIDFGSITLAKGVSLEDVEVFRALYEENCEGVMTAVVREHFNAVDAVWQQFWKPLREDIGLAATASHDGAELALELQVGSGSGGDLLDEDSGGGEVDARQLSGAKIYLLCKCPAIQEFVRQADYTFYQYMVNYLIPDVLKPIPSHLTQAIRNFAKNLEGWLSVAMEGAPPEIVHIKLAAVNAFSQMLRRYTSLNHLAQAARAVLHNASQIQQMLNDLNRVDFYHVQEQASWVCDCDRDAVSQIEREFKEALQRQNTLEQWALWLEDVVTRSLARFENAQKFHRAARRFLLNWSFYSSMVIRDLTLRSAASFGSFHLIRLLYDEYMFYLVEHKVAAVTSASPIAIMGDFLADGQTNFANPVIYVSANDAGGNGPVGKRGNDVCASSASVLEAEPSSSSSPSSATLVPCLQPAKPDPSECVVFGTKRKLVPANGPVSDDGSVAVVLKQQQQPSMDGHLQENFQLAKRMKSFQ